MKQAAVSSGDAWAGWERRARIAEQSLETAKLRISNHKTIINHLQNQILEKNVLIKGLEKDLFETDKELKLRISWIEDGKKLVDYYRKESERLQTLYNQVQIKFSS